MDTSPSNISDSRNDNIFFILLSIIFFPIIIVVIYKNINPDGIQAIFTIVLVAVTCVYVWKTNQLVNISNNQSIIATRQSDILDTQTTIMNNQMYYMERPLIETKFVTGEVYFNDESYLKIEIRNHGNGTAINLHTSIVLEMNSPDETYKPMPLMFDNYKTSKINTFLESNDSYKCLEFNDNHYNSKFLREIWKKSIKDRINKLSDSNKENFNVAEKLKSIEIFFKNSDNNKYEGDIDSLRELFNELNNYPENPILRVIHVYKNFLDQYFYIEVPISVFYDLSHDSSKKEGSQYYYELKMHEYKDIIFRPISEKEKLQVISALKLNQPILFLS